MCGSSVVPKTRNQFNISAGLDLWSTFLYSWDACNRGGWTMGQTHDETTQNLAERLCWEVARRDDARVARRLYRKQLVDGVYRLDEGALLDDFFHYLQAIGVMALLDQVHGTAIQREMRP